MLDAQRGPLDLHCLTQEPGGGLHISAVERHQGPIVQRHRKVWMVRAHGTLQNRQYTIEQQLRLAQSSLIVTQQGQIDHDLGGLGMLRSQRLLINVAGLDKRRLGPSEVRQFATHVAQVVQRLGIGRALFSAGLRQQVHGLAQASLGGRQVARRLFDRGHTGQRRRITVSIARLGALVDCQRFFGQRPRVGEFARVGQDQAELLYRAGIVGVVAAAGRRDTLERIALDLLGLAEAGLHAQHIGQVGERNRASRMLASQSLFVAGDHFAKCSLSLDPLARFF